MLCRPALNVQQSQILQCSDALNVILSTTTKKSAEYWKKSQAGALRV